jgi:hypothetical protein
MERQARRSPGWPALVLGYFVLAMATVLYGALVYVAVMQFKQPIPGVSRGPLEVMRHVVLIPGLLPWLIAATWALTLHFGGSIARGLVLIPLSIVVHYFVFAVSAHSDNGYPWFQGAEFLFAAYCVVSMVRSVGKSSSSMS